MPNTASITVNVNADDKRRAEQLFDSLGLNMSTAFNMFIKQALLCDGLPFEVSLHNENDDYFYSKANTAHLDHSIAQLESGNAKPHDLLEVDENE